MLKHLFKKPQAQNNFTVEFEDADWKKEWLDIFSSQVVSANINLVDQTLQLKVRQLNQGHIQDLILHVLDSEYQMIDKARVYPIHGRSYEYVFTRGKLVHHNVGFNYSKRDPVVHTLVFDFEKVTLHSNKPHAVKQHRELTRKAERSILMG